MIIIGEKINGAIPSVKKAITERDVELIRQRAIAQDKAGAHFIDCAPSTTPELEYDAMVWLIGLIQEVTDKPVCIDSPDAKLLARILEEGHVKKPGMVNSVNEEGDKCETIFPLIAGTDWNVVGLTCDKDGIPSVPEKKIDIAKSIIDKAVHYGVKLENLHIDPCVMALSTMASSMKDFERCIVGIHDYAPSVKVTGAISNISFEMNEYEAVILTMRQSGCTRREIADELGLSVKQIETWITRYNKRQALLLSGKERKVRGRPRKDGKPLQERLETEVKRLRMENKLLRDFLQSTERM